MQGIRYQEATRVAGPWEYGALAAAGKRRGLDEAVDSVKAGVPLHEVAAEYSLAWVSHGKGLTSLRQMLKPDADRRSFGPDGPEGGSSGVPSGTGKSRWVVVGPTPSGRRRSPSGGMATRGRRPWSLTTSRLRDAPCRATAPPGLVSSLGRGQGRQCAHAGQEVCPYGEYFARGLVPRPMSTARYGAV